jgi:hypothetical protein
MPSTGLLYAIAVAVLVTGCAGGGVGSNQADFIKALATDPASNCVVVSTPYGGILVARGTPGTKVNLAGGTCSIDGGSK